MAILIDPRPLADSHFSMRISSNWVLSGSLTLFRLFGE